VPQRGNASAGQRVRHYVSATGTNKSIKILLKTQALAANRVEMPVNNPISIPTCLFVVNEETQSLFDIAIHARDHFN